MAKSFKESVYLEKIRHMEQQILELQQAVVTGDSRAMHYRQQAQSYKEAKDLEHLENLELKKQLHQVLGKQVNEVEHQQLQINYDKLVADTRKLKKELKQWVEKIKV